MKLKLVAASLSFILTLSLAACSDTNETTDIASGESVLEPPELIIHADREMFSPIRGTYSWSVDNGDGTYDGLEADSAAPPELVRMTEPIQVTEDTTITLDFEEEPDSYTVRIWDDDKTILRSSREVDLSGEGEVIYEVWARWPQGTASYAFLLNIK